MQFWKDKLCGDEVLCTTLPSLYVIVDFKENWVKNVWHTTVEGNYWAHRFSRLLNDWDLDLIERFLLSFQVRSVYREKENKVIWIRSNSGKFSVKVLHSTLELESIMSFSTSVIWNSWVSKVTFTLGMQLRQRC